MKAAWHIRPATRAAAVMLALAMGSSAVAQTALAQLGLTETTARNFVLDEVRAPSLDRLTPVALAGTRGFLKLPAPARGPAATALFAWAKAYVNSPAFRSAYAQHRKNVGAESQNSSVSVDDEVQQKINSELARFAAMRKEAASLPPEIAAKMQETLQVAEQNLRSPATASAYRQEIEAARGNRSGQDAALALKLPADPQLLFAGRLREFIEATADVNFSARTFSLNGDADGIVFLDRPDRKRHWLWQEAVIVGPEATTAARTAAQTWLKELER